jgi:hypothetical protein
MPFLQRAGFSLLTESSSRENFASEHEVRNPREGDDLLAGNTIANDN